MSTKPEISVIIPVYNASDTIKKSILSVLEQSYKDYEIIIVDDASTDDITTTLNDIDYPDLKIIHHKKNRGAANARNTGVKEAKGKYVAFLDSDDTWMPDKLKIQHDYMENLKETENTKASCTSFCITHLSHTKSDRILRVDRRWGRALIAGCNVSPGSTLMAERSLFEENNVGPYPTQLRRLEDWDWLITYISKYRLGIIPDILADIKVTGYPPYKVVKKSAEKLKYRKSDFVKRNFGKRKLNVFYAGLHVEMSNAAFRQKSYLTSVKHIIIVFLLSPATFWMFVKRIYYKLKNKIRSQKG